MNFGLIVTEQGDDHGGTGSCLAQGVENMRQIKSIGRVYVVPVRRENLKAPRGRQLLAPLREVGAVVKVRVMEPRQIFPRA
jgi:hypothetical protein